MLEKLKRKDPIKEKVEGEILANLEVMESIADADSESYSKVLRNVERLEALRKKERKKLDPNSCLVVAGNLVGILMILCYEQKDYIRSKALGFVLKGRV